MSTPLVPPIAPSAVYRLANLDDLDAAYASGDFIYARDGHPNATALAEAIDAFEGAAWGQIVGSGMAATAVAVLALCPPGNRILAADQLYGKTFKLFAQLAPRGLDVKYVNVADHAAVKGAIAGCAVLFVETISNPLMALADLESLAAIAHDAGAKLVVDNTFASPAVVKPLALGADVVFESLTKMIGGHSDLTLGYLGGSDPALKATVADIASTWGFFAAPFDCWLAHRGLGTLELRMSAASANAKTLFEWLRAKGIKTYYPGIANMLAFELANRNAVNRFMTASGIPFCPSLGHHETTLSYPWSTSHRAVSDAEKTRLGITQGLVRVSVGTEKIEALIERFNNAL